MALLLGCRPDPAPEPPAPHFDEWEHLVPAVLLGRRATYLAMTRSLTGPDSADVGAAAGFLQVATPDERVHALQKLAQACGGCHRAASVMAPTRPQTHRYVGVAVLDGLAFPRPGEPRKDPSTLHLCSGCHDEDGRVRSDLE